MSDIILEIRKRRVLPALGVYIGADRNTRPVPTKNSVHE